MTGTSSCTRFRKMEPSVPRVTTHHFITLFLYPTHHFYYQITNWSLSSPLLLKHLVGPQRPVAEILREQPIASSDINLNMTYIIHALTFYSISKVGAACLVASGQPSPQLISHIEEHDTTEAKQGIIPVSWWKQCLWY